MEITSMIVYYKEEHALFYLELNYRYTPDPVDYVLPGLFLLKHSLI
jgi:hypothetical protein